MSVVSDQMVSNASDPLVTSFALERPALKVRRRDAKAFHGSLPYFLAGEENRMVSFLAQSDAAVFEFGNPILLLGPSGVGKTSIALHLAARQTVASGRDGEPSSAVCMPAVDFARQYADAVASDDMPPFRTMIDQAPILVIDDLHLIADKGAAQDELSCRIDARTRENRATILTCRRLPSEIRGMRSMLVSRVLPGLTVPISPPVGATRRQLLRELSLHHGLEIEDDLLDLLASGLDSNLPTRSLEAAIKQILLWCRMNESRPSAAAVQSAIDLTGRNEEVSLVSITNAVSRYFRQKSADLRSSSRKQRIVRARSLAMFLARQLTSKSMHQIGDYFGGRDHTTVLHAIRKTESQLLDDADLRRAADEVAEKLSA
ncbi:MAG: DnaA/Hda family protein [Pirellulales bacterium]|nr:DnaA/Hda family protein [Pirellulales bacterium]